MQEHFHNKTEKYEKQIFSSFAEKGMSLKYIGKKALKIDDFEVFIDKKWYLNNKALDKLKEKGLSFN